MYSSAQCVLSVVGSVGVILLFAGIPQLIYSPVVNVANLMTFLLGAILITTMVAGNSFLNYKYRRFEREARERRRANRDSATEGVTTGDPEDKPPSYDAILTSDGLPPDYYSILSEKPPKYEDIEGGVSSNSPGSRSSSISTDTNTDSIAIISEAASSTEVTSFSSVGIDSLPQVFQSKAVTKDEPNSFEKVVASINAERSREREIERNNESQVESSHKSYDERSRESREGSQESEGIINETIDNIYQETGSRLETDAERPEGPKEINHRDDNSLRRLESRGSVVNLGESESW